MCPPVSNAGNCPSIIDQMIITRAGLYATNWAVGPEPGKQYKRALNGGKDLVMVVDHAKLFRERSTNMHPNGRPITGLTFDGPMIIGGDLLHTQCLSASYLRINEEWLCLWAREFFMEEFCVTMVSHHKLPEDQAKSIRAAFEAHAEGVSKTRNQRGGHDTRGVEQWCRGNTQ